MAAIDKIYVNSWKEYLQFKEWCEQQPLLKDKYGKYIKLSAYLYDYDEEWESCHPIFNAPYYVDAYVIRNCPFEFIQKELMINYGYWSQERIKKFYEDVKNWKEDDKCPYWAKLEDFITLEDGTMTIKGLEESDYSKIKRGCLYSSPFTSCKYTIGKHFKCIKHPSFMFNTPLKCKYYLVEIKLPENIKGFMWYHKETNSWDFSDEFVVSNQSSSCAHCKTIRALKRLIIKWKLPVGTIVNVTGRYIEDDYQFIVKI